MGGRDASLTIAASSRRSCTEYFSGMGRIEPGRRSSRRSVETQRLIRRNSASSVRSSRSSSRVCTVTRTSVPFLAAKYASGSEGDERLGSVLNGCHRCWAGQTGGADRISRRSRKREPPIPLLGRPAGKPPSSALVARLLRKRRVSLESRNPPIIGTVGGARYVACPPEGAYDHVRVRVGPGSHTFRSVATGTSGGLLLAPTRRDATSP